MQGKIMQLTHENLRERLRQAFPHAVIEVEPESLLRLHLLKNLTDKEDQPNCFLVRVIDARFTSLHRIARHWLIYDAVCDWMAEYAVALKIVPVTHRETRQVLDDPFAALLFDMKYATNLLYFNGYEACAVPTAAPTNKKLVWPNAHAENTLRKKLQALNLTGNT